jgi:hypothetical protein
MHARCPRGRLYACPLHPCIAETRAAGARSDRDEDPIVSFLERRRYARRLALRIKPSANTLFLVIWYIGTKFVGMSVRGGIKNNNTKR